MNLGYRTAARPLMTAVAAFLSLSALAGQAMAQEYLFFSSDIHDREDVLLNEIGAHCYTEGYGNSCETIGLVGDFNLHDPNPVDSTAQDTSQLALDIYTRLQWQLNTTNLVYSQGNHDEENETFSAAGGHVTGPVALYDNQFYNIYRINSEDFKDACSGLETYLANVTSKMLFVMSHYPLHSSRSDIDQTAATCIYNALSAAAGKGQDITFLWGHNHLRDGRPDYDANVRMIATPGQTLKMNSGNSYLNAIASNTLNFSYVNAGYSKTGSSTLFVVHDAWMAIFRNGVGSEVGWLYR